MKLIKISDIPWFIQPIYKLLSLIIASTMYGICALLRFSCRIRFEGVQNHDIAKNYIYCLWHQSLALYFVVFIRHKGKHIWMNHPSWTMKPIHLWLWISGIKELALGSSGNSGKQALEKVIIYLKSGFNTLITPDGPSGPPYELKQGVLMMSIESGVPVVPVKIIPGHCVTIPTWDRKKIPLPFSTIRVVYGKPITVTKENINESAEWIRQALR